MANIKIKWNKDGLHEIRTSPEAAAMVNSYLESWCEQANRIGKGTYGWEGHEGRKQPQGRFRGTVFTKDWRAMRDTMKNNTLLRVVGSSG